MNQNPGIIGKKIGVTEIGFDRQGRGHPRHRRSGAAASSSASARFEKDKYSSKCLFSVASFSICSDSGLSSLAYLYAFLGVWLIFRAQYGRPFWSSSDGRGWT